MTEEEYKSLMKEPIRTEKTITFKCKPTYQFQSIEFDYVCGGKHDIPKLMELYSLVLNELMKIAPEQEKKTATPITSNLATDKQKEIMRKYGIKFSPNITKSEATELIQESMDNSR